VSKFVLRPAFGFGTNPLLVNLNTWNKLPEADKKILLEEAAKAEERRFKDASRLMVEDKKALIAKGLTVVQMGEAQKAKLKQAWSDGLWELAAQKHKKEVDELRAFAKSKGL
jgi:TRAP-type C4-dicarboxylate transport system substrate-binding protein